MVLALEIHRHQHVDLIDLSHTKKHQRFLLASMMDLLAKAYRQDLQRYLD
jgi:hypothetical protein